MFGQQLTECCVDVPLVAFSDKLSMYVPDKGSQVLKLLIYVSSPERGSDTSPAHPYP